MPQEEADANSALSQPRCEIEKTPLVEEECERPGEVRYGGVFLLCGPHAALLGLEDRAEALLGSVLRMDEWMEQRMDKNGSLSADEEFVGRIRHEREEALDALRMIRAEFRSTREALTEPTSGDLVQTRRRLELMAALHCPCQQGIDIWGEVWWVGGQHRWVFFDDEKTSETYAQQITRCPGCGKTLERNEMRAAVHSGVRGHSPGPNGPEPL
jgi:hypothetical protein